MTITRDDLLNLMRDILSITTDEILPKLGPDEDIVPCMFIADSENMIVGIAQVELPDTAEERSQVDEVLRVKLKEMQASAYVFQMMGWMVELGKDEKVSTTLKPPLHPRRIESLIMTAGSKDAFITHIYKVIRDDAKVISKLEDASMPVSALTHGLFINMLGAGGANTVH